MFVSLTRLRVRSIRFLPRFSVHLLRTVWQIRRSPGFQRGELLADRQWTFWTMTGWDDEASMRRYMTAGSHKQAMPYLLDWCDEASVAHWGNAEAALVPWEEADERMRATGRASKVRNPSPNHAGLSYAAPRTRGAASIRPAS